MEASELTIAGSFDHSSSTVGSVSHASERLSSGLTTVGVISPEMAYRAAFANATQGIRQQLESFERRIQAELQSESPAIAEILRYVSKLGGKRLRPALTFLCAELFNGSTVEGSTEETERLAVVVELVHTATLVHDDVLDEASVRRHQATVHVRWDVPTSILIGDWLFTHAYGLANAGTSTIPGRWVATAAKEVCEGEILQNRSIGNWRLSEAEYIDLLAKKTGALCGVSCALGAWSAGADEQACEALRSFGIKLGCAFQIFDDWLDVWGSAHQAGKTIGTDFAHDKPTLPWMIALASLSEEERNGWHDRFVCDSEGAKGELIGLLGPSNASERTLQKAGLLMESACKDLSNAWSRVGTEEIGRAHV